MTLLQIIIDSFIVIEDSFIQWLHVYYSVSFLLLKIYCYIIISSHSDSKMYCHWYNFFFLPCIWSSNLITKLNWDHFWRFSKFWRNPLTWHHWCFKKRIHLTWYSSLTFNSLGVFSHHFTQTNSANCPACSILWISKLSLSSIFWIHFHISLIFKVTRMLQLCTK